MTYQQWRRKQQEALERAPVMRLELAVRSHEPRADYEPPSFLDFLVDGESLYDRWGRFVDGRVGVLGAFFEKTDAAMRRVLLGERPSYFGAGRVPLFLCGCGDFYCYTFTAERIVDADTIVWTHFLATQMPDGSGAHWQSFLDEPPLRFDARQYRAALENAPRVPR